MNEEYIQASKKIESLLIGLSESREIHKSGVNLSGKIYSRYDRSEEFFKRSFRILELLNVDLSFFKHIFHITGTSGKGSISHMIYESLIKDQKLCGMYTSPHLQVQTERIQYNGMLASVDEYSNAVRLLFDKVSPHLIKEGLGNMTYFQALFSIALYIFYLAKIDTLVIEVGMGGYSDYTNVFSQEKICVISNVGKDHIEYLGPNLSDIAYNKAGIITKGSKVVTGVEGELLDVINDFARLKGAEVFDKTKFSYRADRRGVDLKFNQDNIDYYISNRLNSPLFQYDNLLLASFARYLFDKGKVDNITNVEGRFEVLSDNPKVIIDAAHNEDKAKALMGSFVTSLTDTKKPIILLGLTEGHGWKNILKVLIVYTDYLILTHPNVIGNKKYVDENEIRDYINKLNSNLKVEIITDSKKASLISINKAKKLDKPLIITGSMYLIGDARGLYYSPENILKERDMFPT